MDTVSHGLTLPDASRVDVGLDRVGGVEGLVVVDDEHVLLQSVDTGGVHRCILERREERWRKEHSGSVRCNVISDLSCSAMCIL